jgi:hypothetical protein
MGTVIDLAAVRATRQAAQAAQAMPPAAPASAPAAPLHWQQSQRGNWWTRDARNGIHFVIFENQRGWAGRVTMPWGQAWFENMPSVSSAEEARDWAEEWLGTHGVPNAAGRTRP